MKLNLKSGEVLGCGQFAPSGTLMHLNPCPLYSLVAPGLFPSQCSATARHPQLLASASALATSLLAIPFRRNPSRTATFDMYAIPALQVPQKNSGYSCFRIDLLCKRASGDWSCEHLLCIRGPFRGRKSASVSTVRIPATLPLLRLNLPSNPPILKPSFPNRNTSLAEQPVTATKHTLWWPLGTEKPENIPINLLTLRRKPR